MTGVPELFAMTSDSGQTPVGHQGDDLDDEVILTVVTKRYDRERDRSPNRPSNPFLVKRSYSISWLPKKFATMEQMEMIQTTDSKLLDKDNQWRWHNIASILAEGYCVFDAHLDSIFQGFKSTVWNCKGTCPIHGRIHHGNRWALINTPGFPNTTLVECFHDGAKFLVGKLPF